MHGSAVWSEGLCDINGAQVRYVRTVGAMPTIVLLHGLMGSGACWTELARDLENEFDVIMPDARGHGSSSGPDDGYTYDALADDVLGITERLNLSHPILIGHSMGGMTAALADTTQPNQLPSARSRRPDVPQPRASTGGVGERRGRSTSPRVGDVAIRTGGRCPRKAPATIT